jgi:hypothetical protein
MARITPPSSSASGASSGVYETLLVDTAAGAAYSVDLDDGTVHDVTLTANCTLTFPSGLDTGKAYSFTLVLRNNGTDYTVTWPASAKWPGAAAPTLTTTTDNADVLVFLTVDGGASWLAKVAMANVAPAAAADTTAPAVPTGLTGTAGDTTVTWDWADNAEGDLHGSQPYDIRVGLLDPPTDGSAVAKASSSHSSTGLTNDVAVYAQVRARDTSGNVSDWSASATATPTDAGGFDYTSIGTVIARYDAGAESFADAAAVDQLTDQSGNGVHATQGTAGNRPVFVVDAFGSGLHAVRFDGTNDYLITSAFGASKAQPNLVALVVDTSRGINTSGSRTFFAGRDGTAHNIGLDGSGNLAMNAGTSRTGTSGGSALAVIVGYFNGAGARLYLNGGTDLITQDIGANALVGITLGANHSLTNFSDMDLAECVAYESVSGTLVDQINALGDHLATKYGLTWTTVV